MPRPEQTATDLLKEWQRQDRINENECRRDGLLPDELVEKRNAERQRFEDHSRGRELVRPGWFGTE